MKTRKEIEDDVFEMVNGKKADYQTAAFLAVTVRLLLDIRDLLEEANKITNEPAPKDQ